MDVVVVIPAYQPPAELPGLVRTLAGAGVRAVVVVDDGSDTAYQPCFDAIVEIPGVRLVRHAANLGKGAALKTGIATALDAFPSTPGVVTADADGQHLAEDILNVARELAEHPQQLILGARRFDRSVPWRSRAGNRLTRVVLGILSGHRILDTQTGLRGIPSTLVPELLHIPANGYEFELDMLIAAKHQGVAVSEIPIRTIYFDGNRRSHFNPLLDSMKISFVLLRFTLLSLATALLDNLVFFAIFRTAGSILLAQVVGRVVAVLFNYTRARRAVFLSGEPHRSTLPKYLLLVAANAALAYALILAWMPGMGLLTSKVVVESGLFLFSFVIQREYIFVKQRPRADATDWSGYYAATPCTARLTRKYTQRVLLKMMRRCGQIETVVELGGGNSCFLDRVVEETHPRTYHVVDNNRCGLELLRRRTSGTTPIRIHDCDLLKTAPDLRADFVFSVGLIEHFGPEGTRRVLLRHFDLLKPGGYAVISFPTPTLLYCMSRAVTESLGLWKFPDERPLRREEVAATAKDRGEILSEKLLWPLFFTQRMILVQKNI